MELELAPVKVLIVDDEPLNLSMLGEELRDAGYHTYTASNGQEALDVLREKGDINVVALDRMMPVMDGMECHARIKEDALLKHIPVIMQTAAASDEQIREGIDAGVYYYLTKPYAPDVLIGIVRAALRDKHERDNLLGSVSDDDAFGLDEELTFRFRTLDEAKEVCLNVSRAFPNPKKAAIGMMELATNAIEHGNLGIHYAKKKQLLIEQRWPEEIEKRLAMPEYQDKYATLSVHPAEAGYEVVIADEGEGFNWHRYMEYDPARVTDPNGRGIYIALKTSFDSMQYNEAGNEVTGFIAKE